jgi:hypothetical protein
LPNPARNPHSYGPLERSDVAASCSASPSTKQVTPVVVVAPLTISMPRTRAWDTTIEVDSLLTGAWASAVTSGPRPPVALIWPPHRRRSRRSARRSGVARSGGRARQQCPEEGGRRAQLDAVGVLSEIAGRPRRLPVPSSLEGSTRLVRTRRVDGPRSNHVPGPTHRTGYPAAKPVRFSRAIGARPPRSASRSRLRQLRQ